MMRLRRTAIAALITATVATGATACGDDDPKAEPTSPTTSATPTPTTPAWKDKFTPQQAKQYEAALSRWTEYEQRAEPFFARGQVTQAAKDLFAEYWVLSAIPEKDLAFYEEIGGKVRGLPNVIWSRPAKVQDRSGAVSVEIEQCIDPSTIHDTYPEGTQIEEKKQGPYVRRISLDRLGAKPFKITSVFDITSGKKVTPCEP